MSDILEDVGFFKRFIDREKIFVVLFLCFLYSCFFYVECFIKVVDLDWLFVEFFEKVDVCVENDRV